MNICCRISLLLYNKILKTILFVYMNYASHYYVLEWENVLFWLDWKRIYSFIFRSTQTAKIYIYIYIYIYILGMGTNIRIFEYSKKGRIFEYCFRIRIFVLSLRIYFFKLFVQFWQRSRVGANHDYGWSDKECVCFVCGVFTAYVKP